ncbi:MAG: metalloprotease TldD [Gammaproteobacteria bacterium]|nr:metalloprotease TldD [Gammaproteobacteria bacterium]
MPELIEIARNTILTPSGLTDSDLDRLLSQLLSGNIDAADAYFQASRLESWVLEDGIIKEGNFNIDQGVGVRAIAGEKTGFAYTDEIQLATLLEAGVTARAIASSGSDRMIKVKATSAKHQLYQPINPLQSISDQAKIDLLHRLDAEARQQDPRVKRVIASLVAAHDVVLVVSSDGTLCGDVRPLIRCGVHVIAEQDGKFEQGTGGGGARQGLQFFLEQDKALSYARDAVRQALLNLEADAAPAGTMPVVLGSGWPGILLHEAVGHGLEGDFNRKGTSAFSGRIGEQVAAKGCTVVDDGTLPGRRGSLNTDDEGTPSQYNVLIEDGILKGYMQDKLNASLMGVAPTGNGRRESYAHLPLPRMTNTYMLPGERHPEEIIASVEKGLYAVNFGGGQVDITSGKFVFSTSEAYLIENGKVTRPVKGATLIGSGPEAMSQISMIGNDLELDAGVGTCGKEGQSVPVGVGQPTLKIDNLTVGGTST